ncbi:MAG: transposase, partial [Nitrospiraceae bacterium]
PLIWTLLPSAGNSNTQARTDLLDRLQAAFPDLKIASLMGDREFIGDAWMAYLRERRIPFVLRLRENQHVVREGYDTWMIADIARRLGKGQKMILKGWCRLGQDAGDRSPLVRLVVMRLPTNELLALACSSKPHRALAAYRQRWTIETLFANLKTKGFNLEDTHITAPGKLSTLLAVLALTVTLCVKTGVAAARLRPIPIKKHGRRAWSLSAFGLAALGKIEACATPVQIIVFLQRLMSPKLPVNQLKLMRF